MIRGMHGRWSGPPPLPHPTITSLRLLSLSAAVHCGIENIRKIPIGSTNRRTVLGCSIDGSAPTRYAALRGMAWPSRDGVFNCGRVSDFRHLRGCLSFLCGQESKWSCPRQGLTRSNLQLDLPVLEQHHHSRGGTRDRARLSPTFRDLLALHDRIGLDFHRGNREGMVSTHLSRGPDHQYQPLRDHILLAGWPARVPRYCRPHRTVDHHDFHGAGIRATGPRGTYRSLCHVLALRRCDLGGSALSGVFHSAITVSGNDGSATTIRRRTATGCNDRPTGADGMALLHGSWSGLDL